MPLYRLVLVACAALAPAAAGAGAQQQVQSVPGDFREEFLHQFNTSMSKVVSLAEALPAEKHAWSPGPGIMPLGRVYAHIARFNYHYPSTAMGIPAPSGIDPD